jgi:hypothetical protein
MLLKYRNSAVQAVSISQTLTKMPALAERKNAPVPEKQNARNDQLEETALINFFRQVVRKRPDANINRGGIILPIRLTAGKPFMRQSAASPSANRRSLRQATNELLARLRRETKGPAPVPAAPQQEATAVLYKYRSKASVTNYDLPAIAVNQ